MATKNKKEFIFTIGWRVEPESLDLQTIMDELRGSGRAEIIDIKVEDKVDDEWGE